MKTNQIMLPCAYVVAAALALAAGPARSDPANGAASSGPAAPSAKPETAPLDMPEYSAADSSAPVVTAANLLASERFWPYHVELTKTWKGAGVDSSLPAGTRGVLIRIEESGRARIDFGRYGLAQAVPVADTDLVEQANRIRMGTSTRRKFLPNFVEALGPRLVSTSGESMRPLRVTEVFPNRGFVGVFADPNAETFPALAQSFASLPARADVMTILLPQGRAADLAVYEKLRSLGWKVPFVFQHLSEPYTKSLVGEPLELPYVTLQTQEGRLLLAKKWSPELPAELGAAIDAAFGSASSPIAHEEDPVKKR